MHSNQTIRWHLGADLNFTPISSPTLVFLAISEKDATRKRTQG